MPVANPEKELRFTRVHQARWFAILGAMSFVAGLLLALLVMFRARFPDLPSPWWSLPCFVMAWLGFRIGLRCARHAYLILSPLGVEIFPFFNPVSGMQLVPWAHITEVEFSRHRVTLHYNAEHTAGIHLSLRPLSPLGRKLLEMALHGRLASEAKTTDA